VVEKSNNYYKKEDLLKAFGARLRKLREEKGLSQDELADLANVRKSQIYRIEKGLINTSILTALLLAESLKIPYEDLFKFEEN
jgi:DNA-binding XRE family transcriptional regulator